MRTCVVLLLILTGCGGSMVIPLYDSESVFSLHPGLRGHVVTADEYSNAGPPSGTPGTVLIVGMVNFEGKISSDRAHSLRQLFSMAGGLSRLACIPQILVIRPEEARVIVCDYYRYAQYKESRQNLELRIGDIVVVPRLYSEERNPVAVEWGPVERYLTRQIDREALFRALDR